VIDPAWVAVAQVYATLSVAAATAAGSYDGKYTEDRDRYRMEAAKWHRMALDAIRAAGVVG
jgi:S-methylmethionine-dependent homocysteine/selenocysteine methylase